MIPVYHKPLITYAFDHLIEAGVGEIIVNTHHCPEAYSLEFPENHYDGVTLHFRFEPVLLETGGGIANVADLLGDDPFVVYNGDILTDLPVEPAIERHLASENLVTLVLRSEGAARHIAMDESGERVVDIHGLLGTGHPGAFQFTGIYIVSPEFLKLLEPGVKRSVIPSFLSLIESGRGLGGIVIDDGQWWDLGNREAYLDAHEIMRRIPFPAYYHLIGTDFPPLSELALHPSARIHPDARVGESSVVGEDAVIEAKARVENSIVLRNARVEAGANLTRCIVRPGHSASGEHRDTDF